MKYHVVKTKLAAVAARLVQMVPPHLREKRNGHPGGSGFRTFPSEGIVCSNFQGSSGLLEPGRFKITWQTLEDGVEVGTIEGVEI